MTNGEKNGPKGNPCCNSRCCNRGSRYNRSVSGWFDGDCFTDWFEKTFLPHAKNITGPKALIGDNLSSHFTEKVLKLCKENEIKFICLPPNSTHICQPLDVSFFAPLKKKWREILQDWKKIHMRESAVGKTVFPGLLKKLFDEMGNTMSKNIKAGFAACGIYPLNKERLLKKLPDPTIKNKNNSRTVENNEKTGTNETEVSKKTRTNETEVNEKTGTAETEVTEKTATDEIKMTRNKTKNDDLRERMANVVVNYLQNLRESSNTKSNSNNAKKRKKLEIIPGRSVAADDSPVKKDNNIMTGPSSKRQKMCRKKCLFLSNKKFTADTEMPIVVAETGNDDLQPQERFNMEGQRLKIQSGVWVVAKYSYIKNTTQHFVGQVLETGDEEVTIKFVRTAGKSSFLWPLKDDIDTLAHENIIRLLPEPNIDRRERLHFAVDFSGLNVH